MNTQERQEALETFLHTIFNDYGVPFEVSVNEDSNPDQTDFEVEIRNNKNEVVARPIMGVQKSGTIELQLGEDFYPTDIEDFVMQLFLNSVNKYPET